jgi:RNA polymerase sigma factor (sigma-70 family)
MRSNSSISDRLPAFLAEDHEKAWDEFLKGYSPLILQVVHLFERDHDRIEDCFVFVCERLRRDRLKRIRRFDTRGAASFSTWLRAVVRNLCLDWRRHRFGRPRLFRCVARLPELEQEVFRCLYHRRLGENGTFHAVKAVFPSLTRSDLADSITRVNTCLSQHQSWLLVSSNPRVESISGAPRNPVDSDGEIELPDREPDPETCSARLESLAALRKAMSDLPPQQRLVLRLRYEQELSLAQIAHLTRLSNPLAVQRIIQKALATVRERLVTEGVTSESVSVKDA